MNLNHVHLGTKNLDKFISFYNEYFGFVKKFDHGEGAFLANDKDFLIAVDPVDSIPEFPKWFHLGFCLDSEQPVHSLYEKMRKDNVNIARDMIAEKGQFASFYFRDPDGYLVEVSWHNE
jgi:catechol 2,3-dioxygenase-like lactoylglutathione lyase family enzyme